MRGCKKSTLCWDCQNARANYCSWFTNYTPVEGWEVIKTKIKHNPYHLDESYCVLKCPNFKRDKKQKTVKELAKDMGISERTFYRKREREQ